MCERARARAKARAQGALSKPPAKWRMDVALAKILDERRHRHFAPQVGASRSSSSCASRDDEVVVLQNI
jgi:hypothetical protein